MGTRLELRLSPTGNLFAGYARKDLYLLRRNGSLLSRVEFSRTITDLAWLDDTVMVAAGKLVGLALRHS